MEQKQQLVSEFGTLKSKKKVAQMQNNKVDERNIEGNIQDILEEKTLDLKSKLETSHQQKFDYEIEKKREFLPEFNLEESDPSKVYNLYSIIS
jgi:hypothetical protein